VIEEAPDAHSLPEWAAGVAELNHHLAEWLDLPNSDGEAFSQIVWADEAGTPLSPTALSRRIGMTTGATTALLHRLDRGGFITREREEADARRVTLRPTPVKRAALHRFAAASGFELVEVLLAQDSETLNATTRFVTELTEAGRAAIERLRHSGQSRL
jgi:DNA-binding MarR family transcriptional regulator